MDKMIKHANEKLAEFGVNVFYSTPSCFIKALHDEGIRLEFRTVLNPENPEKSGKIRKNPEKSGKIQKNPEKSGKIRKKSGKILKNTEKLKNYRGS